ncbi:hypothetical protein [Tepidibacter formicigenes]|jgi:uncharacterized membrane protein|uniref:Holin n=1 Tax=Tepidibacter formicigenes DSM 15518 TaxID=1123349 RepID=A0A1M6LHP7_9FIRM|nr:hypothetical protein [Tepidibacter formicigenes]SHJ70729.1 hypothetical protein SAMN02744037_00637 [Tepidibacter formicigenes DSM 15518]
MNRWKNYGLWLALFSFIPILLDSLKVYDINLILPGNYSELVIGFLGLLSLAGIISNPKEGTWFSDEKYKKKEDEN